jgi:hypothetical protein
VPGELPDDVVTAGLAARAAASGASGSAAATKLLTVQEMLTAWAAPAACSTRAPGAAG